MPPPKSGDLFAVAAVVPASVGVVLATELPPNRDLTALEVVAGAPPKRDPVVELAAGFPPNRDDAVEVSASVEAAPPNNEGVVVLPSDGAELPPNKDLAAVELAPAFPKSEVVPDVDVAPNKPAEDEVAALDVVEMALVPNREPGVPNEPGVDASILIFWDESTTLGGVLRSWGLLSDGLSEVLETGSVATGAETGVGVAGPSPPAPESGGGWESDAEPGVTLKLNLPLPGAVVAPLPPNRLGAGALSPVELGLAPNSPGAESPDGFPPNKLSPPPMVGLAPNRLDEAPAELTEPNELGAGLSGTPVLVSLELSPSKASVVSSSLRRSAKPLFLDGVAMAPNTSPAP